MSIIIEGISIHEVMNRRIALKNLTLAAVGLIMLPGCEGGWSGKDVQTDGALLSSSQEELLGELTETIIPKTDTPGAKELAVPAFIQKILADCYEKDVQDSFKAGLDQVEKIAETRFDTKFAALSPPQREEVLVQLEQAPEEEQKDFYSLLKGLTIHGYMTSEYVMTNITKYEMVPGRYYGCVPVTSKTLS